MNLIPLFKKSSRLDAVSWAAPVIVLAFAGCAVGPNYHRPTALGTNSLPVAFSSTGRTNVGEWKPAEPSAHLPRGSWWEAFQDPELNRLETLVTANNQQLAAAFANFQQARALVKVARADLLPQVSSTPSLTRQRQSQNQFPGSGALLARGAFNTYSVPVDAAWELDLWGRVRRSVEGARARLVASADDLESTKLAIQAEVAVDYFTLRSFEAQDRVLENTAVAYRRSLELTQDRHNSGIATELDVAQAETQLQSTLAQIPAIQVQRATFLHALAALCGQAATGFEVGVGGDRQPARPPEIPVSVPSELLEDRPDIAAAERRMAAANADIGVAQAAFYPRLILSGAVGYQSFDISTLFDWPSHVWSIGPSLQVPLYTGGRTRAQLESARAGYDAAVANYRQTVIAAFQDVEDQLAQQRYLARELEAENAALRSARRTLDISNIRYKGGVITYLDVVIAQSVALTHEQTVVQLDAQQRTAAVSLIKALGGGWSVETQAKASPTGASATR